MCVCVSGLELKPTCCFFLVSSVSLSVRLPVTPQDYQPPGFMEANGDTMVFEKEPVRLTMGEVATPFHTLKMDMTTERQRLEEVNVRGSKIKVLKSTVGNRRHFARLPASL